MTWRVDHQPALEWLERFDDESVDLIVTDPAYASMEDHRAVGTTTRLKSWFPTVPNEMYPALAVEWRRILRPHGAILLFGNPTVQFETAFPAMLSAGWTIRHGNKQMFKTIHWDKVRLGMGYTTREQVEIILFWRKSTRTRQLDIDRSTRNFYRTFYMDVIDGGDESIAISEKSIRGKRFYPTEKPVALLNRIIRNTTVANDVIVDCFCGSGAHGEAAVRLGRVFLGTDISDAAVQLSRRRLSAIQAGDAVIPARRWRQSDLLAHGS